MSRATRIPKPKEELEAMTLDQLDEELRYLNMRKSLAGRSVVAKLFDKEAVSVRYVRERRFGIPARK